MKAMQTNHDESPRPARPRLLLTAYHYDAVFSMESRLAWHRAQHAARDYDVTVICARGEAGEQRGEHGGSIAVVVLPLSGFERAMMKRTVPYYLGYRRWHARVLAVARQLHADRPFDLVHHVSFCGYREPGDCWRLGVPFVWGPVGGTAQFPTSFLCELEPRAAVRELMRNVINRCQLRFDRRVRQAARTSAVLLAANRSVADVLASRFGVAPKVQLETGVADVRDTPRPKRDVNSPLRILWAGRLRSWKGLPLLLRGLAQLPPACTYRLRVLGQGPAQERWERLATRLGVAEHIEWSGWPEYPEQLPHYNWADVFAFTSLRDTSGTGLLEALAAGVPVVGLDHQGVADIMTSECALRVPATNPVESSAGFATAISRLAGDSDLLARLSAGALARARWYQWDRQWDAFREIYRESRLQGAALVTASPRLATSWASRNSEPDLPPVVGAQSAC
jgi:glycosyltransferase involved in cell wall biosynthesis